jgi:hypothetical protein
MQFENHLFPRWLIDIAALVIVVLSSSKKLFGFLGLLVTGERDNFYMKRANYVGVFSNGTLTRPDASKHLQH